LQPVVRTNANNQQQQANLLFNDMLLQERPGCLPLVSVVIDEAHTLHEKVTTETDAISQEVLFMSRFELHKVGCT
jgi:hypothetical protein